MWSDGVTVSIEQLDGARYREYQNPYEQRLNHYAGGLVGRLVRVLAGQEFRISVDFDDDYNLGKASRVAFIPVLGDGSQHLCRHANTQAFWIPKKHVRGKHRFSTFIIWDSEEEVATRSSEMQMPNPDREYSQTCREKL